MQLWAFIIKPQYVAIAPDTRLVFPVSLTASLARFNCNMLSAFLLPIVNLKYC